MVFTLEKISSQLKDVRKAITRESVAIPWFKYREEPFPGPDGAAAQTGGVECPEYDDQTWQDFHVGDRWGGYDRQAWFRAWVTIPAGWQERKVGLQLVMGPRDGGESTAEALLYMNGSPLQALDAWHTVAWLPAEFLCQERIFIAVKAWSGVIGVPDRRQLKQAGLIWVDEATERFTSLTDTLVNTLQVLDENDLRRVQLLEALNQAFLQVDFYKPGSPAFYGSVQRALECLENRLASLSGQAEIKPTIIGIGHSHIDMAWLWRLRHTREKAARTFSTALRLMEQYPEYRFTHSSPQLYKFLKEDYPEIFARVKEKIRSGQWEITGGMWVEADTNLTSGESLIRQFLYGMRFARQEFGVEMKTLWLPDVFGYSWSLPQIARGCGIQNFLTSKISWNQFNRFPYDTFYWRGIDGTELLTQFVTTPESGAPFYTYNGQMNPQQVLGAWENYRQKEINGRLPLLFGWGDGGGGPTQEMIESALALRDLPGMPRVELGKAEPYLERLGRSLEGKEVPVWDGELYLELHRGTYTSQAFNKRMNRKAEILYHNVEWLSVLADALSGNRQYPVEALQRGWEKILLNQFHDILPGSSIAQVYQDCRDDYREIMESGERMMEAVAGSLALNLVDEQSGLLVLNPLSWARSGLVELPWITEMNERLAGYDFQVYRVDGEERALIYVEDIPALGYRLLPAREAAVLEDNLSAGGQANRIVLAGEAVLEAGSSSMPAPANFGIPDPTVGTGSNGNGSKPNGRGEPQSTGEAAPEITVSKTRLENGFYRIHLNEAGQINSLWDKRSEREVLAPGSRGNVLQAFEDRPMNFDAWDVDIFYQEKMREVTDLVEAVVEEVGPLRGVLRLTWKFYDSTITQRMTIYRDSPRIDFRTEVDWQESQVLLKAAFPVDIRATRATYDIQFGNTERPTHHNTSWDMARFECAGHKWVDLSEGNYGVALLNDCKYGHDVFGNVLRLTLIKSAVSPDATADRGEHIFTYSLLPHTGDWRVGEVVRQAYDLNNPLQARLARAAGAKAAHSLPESFAFARVDCDHVIIETVKQAEDGDGIVVRCYEYQQSRNNRVVMGFGRPIARAVACNLVEEEARPVDFDRNHVYFPIRPYEIRTFKVWLE